MDYLPGGLTLLTGVTQAKGGSSSWLSGVHTRLLSLGVFSAENHEICTTESKGVKTGREKLFPSL